MRSSATSTRRKTSTRLTTLCTVTFLLGIVTTLHSSSTVIAQQAQPATLSPNQARDQETTSAEPGEPGEGTTDSDETARPAGSISPRVIARTFMASAYSIKGRTATGIPVRSGIVAADPKVLPLGSIVRVHAGKYTGIYTVLDTGGAIRGHKIDIYIPSQAEAMRFGRRKVKVEVLRHGWAPSEELADNR